MPETKSKIETKSPNLEEAIDVKPIENPDYSDKEETYLASLKSRMETAQLNRDASHDEFDGMDYPTYFDQCERLANTYIQPKLNKEDSNFQSGTIRTKLMALLNSVVSLDLSGDISAFDKDGLQVQGMGDAMEDIIMKTDELDNDDEKQVLRQYELMKHGTVFVEEIWDERSKKEKKMEKKFDGKITDVKINTQIKKAFARPSRNIIQGKNVYLGDITKYNMEDQPYVFTVDSMPYEEAQMIFGEWDRWANVPKAITPFNEATKTGTWQLLDHEVDYVEIIRYQDKWNNEFAVIINGVLMTPPELPLPWGYEGYNIAQQNLEPINAKFAYGKSLVFRVRNKVAILDEMMKLAVLKTQKSYMPPRYNISGRIVSNRVFMAGKISHGLQPGSLPPIEGENTGVTAAELNMINEMKMSIDAETTSPIFQGQSVGGSQTATEIVELQRQSKQMLGLIIFSVSMLEWKLEWLRLQNLLAHWFNPEDKEIVEGMKSEIKNKYRQVSVKRPIENEGQGMRMVIPTENMPSSQAVMQTEDILSEEQGMPVRMIFLDPEEVTSSKLCWMIVVRPREKRTSETEKLMFRAFMADAQIFGPTLNMDYLGQEFATVWNKDPKKMFKSPEEMMPVGPDGQPLPPEGAPVPGGANLPSPDMMANKAMKSAISTAK